MKKHIFLSGLIFFITTSIISGQYLSTSGTAIVNEQGDTVILRGMGLGGWMLQEGYMLQTAEFASAQHQIKNKIEELIGKEGMEEFYDAWLENHVTRADVDSLAVWGFNSIRLPMHYNLFTLPIEDEPVRGEQTWLDRGFELTDSLISWCKANDMYVILDLHAAPGGQGNDIGISDREPGKPSLWQSPENWDKTVALWGRIAERYADEPWVAGYDLLNEPNWDLPGGLALRKIYEEITDEIRKVNQKHIIIIEGNWFANDFTGLTPPWDDNMVYSPHKYWSYNNQSDITYMTRLFQYDVPVYLGESGENSNAWFRDAVKLAEDNGIGWAWWPEKKVESISGLMSIEKTDAYNDLLEYWNNGGPTPDIATAKATLMEFARNTNILNCRIQKDVPDALIRQPNDDTAIPFKNHTIPGKIYAADYDMGRPGVAYEDAGVATYHVSNGSFTAWNNGWSYRNDGVDIEPTTDPNNTIGHNVGWLEPGEWMQYTINVEEPGVYDILVRTASEQSTGKYHFEIGGAAITGTQNTPNTGGWQTWRTSTISNVVFTENDKYLRFVAEESGTNLSSFEFIRTGNIADITTRFSSAITADEQTVQLNLNKPIVNPMTDFSSDFEITVNNSPVTITQSTINPDNSRMLLFTVNQTFKSTDIIRISYSGTDLEAADGTKLQVFSRVLVTNTIAEVTQLPGRLEAENFSFQSGIQLETTTDAGGGQNIGFLAPGDYADYEVDVTRGGNYRIKYRTASESSAGGVKLQRIDESGVAVDLHATTFSITGGWQTWRTSASSFSTLPKGKYKLRLLITGSDFNINWIDFELVSNTQDLQKSDAFSVYPNPGTGIFFIENTGNFQIENVEVFDLIGTKVFSERKGGNTGSVEKVDIKKLNSGTYFLKIYTGNGEVFSQRIIKH